MPDTHWPDTVVAALRPLQSLVCLLPGIRRETPRRNLLIGVLYTLGVASLVGGV